MICTSTPSSPESAPRSIRTKAPVLRKGHSTAMPDATKRLIASSSSLTTALGFYCPMPTRRTTPGIVRIGNRWFTSNALKTYPGKRGNAICLAGPGRRERSRYRGRNCAYPFPFRLDATVLSQFERTHKANQDCELSQVHPYRP